MGISLNMTNAPASYPYRTVLSLEERIELSKARPGKIAIDIAALWLQIIGAWAFAWYTRSIWGLALAAFVVGNRYYSLYIIGHDGLHRRLHPNTRINDLINDIFVLGPIGAITKVNRLNHMRHHRNLGLTSDPDLFKYRSRKHLSALQLLLSFSGLPLVLRAVYNVFFPSHGASEKPPPYTSTDIVILISWQLLLISTLTAAFGLWGYLLLWLLPVAACTVAFDLLRVYCEHSVEKESANMRVTDRMIMIVSSPIERLIFSPMNMNHHVAHHIWPAIPYFNLPRATKLLESRLAQEGITLHKRSSYCNYLIAGVFKAINRAPPFTGA